MFESDRDFFAPSDPKVHQQLNSNQMIHKFTHGPVLKFQPSQRDNTQRWLATASSTVVESLNISPRAMHVTLRGSMGFSSHIR
ncbi:unnamed protein product [Ambrosiozyma monospora]|uniref:Unnamed protein product n=1 Tax=Ambrosiozyma monospora TaxID=43982 RepID=A0ACB5U951_AMBMO|nr:unnamed protein product [Ambrosiozyma monospora]